MAQTHLGGGGPLAMMGGALLLLAMAATPEDPLASQRGEGGMQVCPSQSAGAVRANPSLLQGGHRWNAGAGLTRPVGLPGLLQQGFWSSLQRETWGVGALWQSLQADDVFREDGGVVSGAWGGSRWGVGGGVLWRTQQFPSLHETGASWGGLVAGHLRWRERLLIGAAWEQPGLWKTTWMESAPQLRIGVRYGERDGFWDGMASGEWYPGRVWHWKLGQSAAITPWCTLRAGLNFAPFLLTTGAGFAHKGMRIDWSLEGEPRLGWQNHLELGLSL